MKYILTHESLKLSARLLANGLNEATGGEHKIAVRTEPVCGSPPLIRWGNSSGSYERDTKFNSRKSILLCGNKLAFSNAMEMQGLPTVSLQEDVPQQYPIVVRTLLNANKGKGIIICHSEDEYMANYRKHPWSYWYNFKYELGVHLLGGEVKKLFKKVWVGDGKEAEYPIRNMDKGYSFKRVRPTSFKKLHPAMSNFYHNFDMEMCRLDVGWDTNSGKYVIIEANTAPSLSNNSSTLELYVEYLKGGLRL